jgi:uncharacterized repeat protein (TIGR02059 family)
LPLKNALIILLLILSNSVSATTYYIDPSGKDTNNGSSSSPWNTLSYACSKVKTSGDIIHVNAGTYVETQECSLAVGVSIEGDGVTSIIKSHTASTFTLVLTSSQGVNGNQHISNIKMDGDDLTAYGGIQSSGRSNVIIHDVTFIDFKYVAISVTSGARWGVKPTTYATNNQIYNCDIDNCSGFYDSNGYGQIEFYGTSRLLIHDNNLNQTTRTGANGYLTKAVGGFNEGTKIYNNYFIKAEDYVKFQILLEFWDSEGGIEIYNNEIYGGYIDCGGEYSVKGSYNFSFDIHNNTFGLSALGPSDLWTEGISCEGNQSDIIIRNNNFTNFSFPVLLTQNGTRTIQNIYIYYNIFKTVAAKGSSGYAGVGIYNTSTTAITDGIYILNNVFYNGTTPSSASGVEIWIDGTCRNVFVQNNIFQGLTNASVWFRSGTISNVTIQNNIAYGNGNSNNPMTTVTPANYTYATAIKSNPLFVSSSDFHLQSTSPAINAGIFITTPTILTDYDGVTISNPPEIGAYEYDSEITSPTIPVYQSSVVENGTPTIIVISYNSSLTNIVPSASVFNVQVNSVNRTVSSVAIVGGKVQLTLASGIKYGDLVTLGYTQPATNPLQTASGGQAATISAKTVTNNVSTDIPVYASSAIQNATPNTLEMTYTLSLATIVPAVSAFNVTVNTVARSISTVSISGTKVLLTLTSPVVYGDVVTISYIKPTTNPLQTASGGQAATLSAQAVVNNVSSAIPVYVSSAIQNSSPNTLEITYNLSLATIVPASSAFNVTVSSVARSISTVSISGTKVLLTLTSPVVSGDVVTISYIKPTTNPLQTASGGQAATLSAQVVVNNVSSAIPVYVSSAIQNSSPNTLEITYNLSLATIVPASSAFSVRVNSVARTVNVVSISGAKVLLTLSSPVVYGDVVTVSYTKSSTNPIQTPSGGQAATLSAQAVVNNVSSASPLYVSSEIQNTAPNSLEMTYNLSLATIVPVTSAFSVTVNSVARSINTVSISGTKVLLTLTSPVVYGDIVTVSYTKPATNPLQTPSGGQAATLSAQAVVNNVSPASPVYVSSAIQNTAPNSLEMTFDLSLATIVPAASAFTVTVNSVAKSINTVTISGTKVLLTLTSPVVYGDVVTVSYTKPATNPLQTASGGLAVTISAQSVVNYVSAIPLYVSSDIQNASPSLLSMTYKLNLANIVPTASAFNVMVNNVPRNITSVAISGTKVLLTLASSIVFSDIVTVSYTKPITNPLQTPSGGVAATISAQSVTNKVVNPAILGYVDSEVGDSNPALLQLNYNLTLANVLPLVSAFSVRVNSVTRNVNSVAISGTNVVLTLASAVAYGDVVTVAYNKPATNPLQSTTGLQAATISAQSVTNKISPVSPVYMSSAIQNATPITLEMTYNLSLVTVVPAASAFTVTVNSVARSINTVSISGTKVLLTLANPVVYGDVVTVSYTEPATNPLQTPSGGLAATISAQTVVNNVIPATPPVYVSSIVEPNVLTMTYNLSLTAIVPAASAFTVSVNSVARSINTVSISGTKVLLSLATPVFYGDVVTVSYTKPVTNPLQTPTGGLAASLSALPVTNIVSNPAILAYFNSAVGNSSPTLLEINYNLALANVLPEVSAFSVLVNSVSMNVNSIAISGTSVILTLASSVVNGDVVTVAYNKPVSNPLQSTSGLQAATMSAQSVTNKVDPVGPVYLSSAIENSTPNILEITYNETLDLIAPNVSAFVVMVNGVNREVTSVSISGSKVQLTLANPVVYGDIVTVSYIKPQNNYLKKATGEIAASFSFPQPVTNKLIKKLIIKGNISIYPNPAREFINVSQLEASSEVKFIRIYDFSGKLCSETRLNPYISDIRIPINLKSGTYLVHIANNSLIFFIQKLIVMNY